MLIDLAVEGFTERDGVPRAFFVRRIRGAIRGKPKVQAIEKMKTRGIDQTMGIGPILGTEEYGGGEDAPETLNHSPIVASIGSKAEEIEHLKGSFKADDATVL
jgi:hypothetical protein